MVLLLLSLNTEFSHSDCGKGCSALALLIFNDCWKDRGGKCSPENDKPAAAAACSECKSAAECSCAFRLSSATDVVRGSVELIEFNEDTITAAAVVAEVDKWLQSEWAFSAKLPYGDGVDFKAQHEQKLENPKISINFLLSKY